ncbi:MAG: DPP IV N-terminal domain-containing protein [Bacteroidales bacterium]|jgi:dipeptidyl aminopeptidase/acylaminoacyl peptidase|nr:DPP IV N-terminal domain-containing protein [Bacteroidales bacterium]MCI1784916.1 DPP IV N-terminal domain-containing protein [Bacteroidales bacterium]
MKRHLVFAVLFCLATGMEAQTPVAAGLPGNRFPGDEYVHTANYDLAERFSAKKVNQMVYSTQIKPNWFMDSDKFWYSWKTSEGTGYWLVDAAGGKKTEIFDMPQLAMQLTEIIKDPFDAQHIPIKDLKLKDDRFFTFDIESSRDKPLESADTAKTAKGKIKDGKKGGLKPEKMIFHFEYDYKTETLRDVTAEKEKEQKKYPEWANVSPDGKTGVYVKNCNLFYMDSTSLRKAAKDPKDSTIIEHRLTEDGTRDFCYGTDNYMGDTVTDTAKRVCPYSLLWSPDSRHFASIRWDMSKIKDLWVINSLSMPRPKLETYKYQMPGEAGPKGYLYIFDMADSRRSYVRTMAFKDQDMEILRARETAADKYKEYYSGTWLGSDDGFYLNRISRDLKRNDLCYVQIGKDSTRTVISERENTYIETRNPYLLKDGKELIYWSERNGWANLYLYGADGKLIRPIVTGPFHVEDVLGVNESEGYLIFSACGFEKDENPYQMHNFRINLKGGKPVRLDMKDMDVLATASYDAKYLVANYSRVDSRPAAALLSANGKKMMELEKADFSRLFASGYKFPERFKVKAADGITDLYGVMYKPFDFDSTKIYPVCDYVYPGPQVEANNISWSKNFTRVDRLAQLGFIVITVGNRGGHPDRSKWYHNYGYGNLRDYGLEDQKYAIQQLAGRYHFIDINRVGIHGHSGGGFMSTAAILKYPDFFKVAVSCSGNHDNTIYNRWWSEQHHGILEKVTAGDTSFVYHINTNEEIAKNLKGHLMLCTGDIDNNVHPANTIRVVDALIRAHKRFDLLVLPGQRHGYGNMNEYFFWKMADFYSEYLMGSGQRHTVDIYQMNND